MRSALKLPAEFKGTIETEERDFKYEETNSEETTVKANQIIKNLDLSKAWADDKESKLTERNYEHFNYENEDFEINENDFQRHVETIEEENEPESNLSTLINNNSIRDIEIMGSQHESDHMYVNNISLKNEKIIAPNTNSKIVQRGEMNSTMKNFNQDSSNKKHGGDNMKTTAKFANVCDPRTSEFNFIDLVIENEKDPKKLISKKIL